MNVNLQLQVGVRLCSYNFQTNVKYKSKMINVIVVQFLNKYQFNQKIDKNVQVFYACFFFLMKIYK